MRGYMHLSYVMSLSEFGAPRKLPLSGGWILERQIPGFFYMDAMGCYPIFCCQDWKKLSDDLEKIGDQLVSLSLVTDPFGKFDKEILKRYFKDLFIPFKKHFVIDLTNPKNLHISKHHRYYARKALSNVCVEEISEPIGFIDEWIFLYNKLIKRHKIQGIRAFSKESFAKLLINPDISILRAVFKGKTVAAQIYLKQGNVTHCHLGAANETGYELYAIYALDWYSIGYFSGKTNWLNLGGGQNRYGNSNDGLSRYKKGWTDYSRIAYLCGRIYNHNAYNKIVKKKDCGITNYFPAYRKGEF